jgi:hypothetical protein
METGTRVRVICDNEGGGGDEWAIDEVGTVRESDEDGYCEVELDEHGTETFQFGEYQLEEINEN